MRRQGSIILGILAGVSLLAFASLSLPSTGLGLPKTQAVEVKLAEWKLGFKNLNVESGRMDLSVVNNGRIPHALALTWRDTRGEYVIETPLLESGERVSIVLSLPPGTYEAFCPVHGHRLLGMDGTVKVNEAGKGS